MRRPRWGMALMDRRHDGERAVHPPHHIPQRNAQLFRRGVRGAVHAYDAAQGLGNDVEGGLVPQRPMSAEAADGAINQPWIELRQLFVAQSQGIHDAGPVVFHQHVGLAGEIHYRLHPFGFLEVEHQAFLVAVERNEIMALAVDKRRHDADVVAFARRLDFQDLGPQVPQQHGGVRPGQHRLVQHFDVGQGPAHPGFSIISL